MSKHVLRLGLAIFFATLFTASSRAQKVDDAIPKHRVILKSLISDPGAMRSFRLNADGEIIYIWTCGRLSPKQVAAVNGIDTLEHLTIGGDLPYRRMRPTWEPKYLHASPESSPLAIAEKNRQVSFPSALPKLGSLSGLKKLICLDALTAKDLEVVTTWRDLESLSTPLSNQLTPNLAPLKKLKELVIKSVAKPDSKANAEVSSGAFLASFPLLDRLTLPASYDAETLHHLRNSSHLKQIRAPGVSGEKLVAYFENSRGFSLFDAMKASGYRIEQNADGNIVYLSLYSSEEQQMYSESIFDRLVHLETLSFSSQSATGEQNFLRMVKGKQLTALMVSGSAFSPSIVGKICEMKSLESIVLSIAQPNDQSVSKMAFSPISLPTIHDLPNLQKLVIGNASFRTDVAGYEKLPVLTHLVHHNGNLTAGLGSDIAALPKLSGLDLRGCKLTKPGIAAIGKSSSIRVLNLKKSNLSDAGLEQLASLTELIQVETDDTQVSTSGRARFLRDVMKLPPIALLEGCGARVKVLKSNQRPLNRTVRFYKEFSRELMVAVVQSPRITEVEFVHATSVDVDSLEPLYSAQQIQSINFSHTKAITSKMIERLQVLPELKTLRVVNCNAVEDDPAPFLELNQVEEIELRGKQYSEATLSAAKKP